MVSRGYAKIYLHYSRESGGFVLAVEKSFSFRADWHQDEDAKPLVAQYQLALDSVLKARPDLQPCMVDCAHCGIRFLTHARNAGRRDLHCPFGCQEHHRRQSSNRRSAAYYRTIAGKAKKQTHNRRRYRLSSGGILPAGAMMPASADAAAGSNKAVDTSTTPPGPASPTDAEACRAELRLHGVVLDESSLTSSPVLPYLRMMVGLIEGVRFTIEELLDLLRQALRQHSFGARKRRDYVLHFLLKHPP